MMPYQACHCRNSLGKATLDKAFSIFLLQVDFLTDIDLLAVGMQGHKRTDFCHGFLLSDCGAE
jgi:hypothetical protein